MTAMGREDLGNDQRFLQNEGRSRHVDEIDEAISQWTRQRPAEDALRTLAVADVPAGPIYSAAEMLRDEHYRERGVFEQVELPTGEPLKIPTVAPRLSDTPGGTRWIGPPLGAHNTEVYCDWLGLPASELKRLTDEGVI